MEYCRKMINFGHCQCDADSQNVLIQINMTITELGQLMTIISEELEVPLLSLTRETRFAEIGADNTSVMLLIMEICEQFDIDMAFDDDLEIEKRGIAYGIDSLNSEKSIYNLVTIGDLIDAVDKYL